MADLVMDQTQVASGVGFAEGPVVSQSVVVYLVSIDQGRLYSVVNEETNVFANVGGGPNGAAEGADGEIYIAQNGRHWGAKMAPYQEGMSGGVQLVDANGAISWVTTDLVAPNDLCFGPDGLLYVTDPTRRPSRDDGRLWRIDVRTRRSELLLSVPWYPNGIAFGPDDALYVASSADSQIIRFDVGTGGVSGGKVVVEMPSGFPDGIAFDDTGNLVVAACSQGLGAGEIQIYDPKGSLIDRYSPGNSKHYTNIAFGADQTLYVCDADSGELLAISPWPNTGLPLYPFRG